MPRSQEKGDSRHHITLHDVAREAKVSIGTASRVINSKESVRPVHRQRVLEAIERLGYRPNAIAQSMRKHTANLVGCIVRDINIPVLADFVRAAHDTLTHTGLSLLISNSEGKIERETEILERLARQQCEGAFIASYTRIDSEREEFLRKLNMPIVLIDRDEPGWTDSVLVDHQGAIHQATSHLLRLGHRRIVLLTGEPIIYPARERVSGFRRAFADLDLAVADDQIFATNLGATEGVQLINRLLESDARPTAVIAGSIDMLPGVLTAIDGHGLSIPRDISVVAVGESDLARLRSPAISVEDWNQAYVGRIAAQLMLDRIKGSAVPPQHVLIPSSFVDRGSVCPPA